MTNIINPAIEKIKSFNRKPNLTVNFLHEAVNPYADDLSTMEIYEDENKYEYWIDPKDNKIIQLNLSVNQSPKEPKTISELRSIALSVIEKEIIGFSETSDLYDALEDRNNRLVVNEFYFRFNNKDSLDSILDTDIPPFVQVGLFSDGSIKSFVNCLK